jgi:hypothetical protein
VGELFAIAFGKSGALDRFRVRVMWMRPAGTAFQFGCSFWAVDEEAKRHLLLRLIQFSGLHRAAPRGDQEPGREAEGKPEIPGGPPDEAKAPETGA